VGEVWRGARPGPHSGRTTKTSKPAGVQIINSYDVRRLDEAKAL